MGVCEVIASQKLLKDAFEIAIEDAITIYDALFCFREGEGAPSNSG